MTAKTHAQILHSIRESKRKDENYGEVNSEYFTKAVLHYAMFLETCLATCPSGPDEVKVERVFLLADRTKHCETSCKRGVTLCNASKIRCSVAAIVAKSRTWFYFVQRLLQQKCRETWWLRGMLHHAISRATGVATILRDKLHDKLHNVTPPLVVLLCSTKMCSAVIPSKDLKLPNRTHFKKLHYIWTHYTFMFSTWWTAVTPSVTFCSQWCRWTIFNSVWRDADYTTIN